MKAKDNIKRYSCKNGYIERFHYNRSNIPGNLVVLGPKDNFHGTAYRLNGTGYWFDSNNFVGNFIEYIHFRDQFDADLLWKKAKRGK